MNFRRPAIPASTAIRRQRLPCRLPARRRAARLLTAALLAASWLAPWWALPAAQAQDVTGEGGFVLSMPFSAKVSGRTFGAKSLHFMDIEGVVFNQSGGEFLHRSRIVCNVLNDTGSIYGYCKATDPAGADLLMIVQRLTEPDRLSGAGGEMLFIGGTGEYAGVTGGGTYTIDYETDDDGGAHGLVSMEGLYSVP